jgi:hypothetical protein
VSGNQAFTFIADAAFSNTAGELRYEVSGTGLLLQGDLDGNGSADFAIFVKDAASLAGTDFNL